VKTAFARAPSAACSFGLALVCFWASVVPGVVRAEGPEPCGPFEAGTTGIVELAADRTARDPGVQAPASGGGSGDPGAIVPLPTTSASAAGGEDSRESEALLALPKGSDGAIPTDFELGEGAKIAQSFFSPVICATVARVTGPPGSTLDQLVTVVPDTGIVVPNDVYSSAADELRPVAAVANAPDPYAPLQYGLAISGVREARTLGAGDGVRIALLDSTPELSHRDLAPGRIEAVSTEVPSEASKGKSSPRSSSAGSSSLEKASVHGTLMAGVIGAVENNGFGIAGLAPRARVVSIPVCTATGGAGGQCTIYQLLQGFDRAHDAEAVLVNLSLSGPPNPLLERGVARLEELGLVVVAAAGNDGREEKRYPAAYPSVIGVGAVDRDGRLFRASNRGAWVELYAPGVEVLSTVPGSAFAFGSGTSLAAAHVTGSLAVLTGITGDAKRARSELFRVVNARTGDSLPTLPAVCDVLRRVGRTCGVAKTKASSSPAGPR